MLKPEGVGKHLFMLLIMRDVMYTHDIYSSLTAIRSLYETIHTLSYNIFQPIDKTTLISDPVFVVLIDTNNKNNYWLFAIYSSMIVSVM